MKRANRPILSSLRLIKSLLQTHPSPSLARSLHIQVTHSTPLFPPHSYQFHNKNHNFLKPHHQIHSFSTKSTSFLEIITTNEDWSEELEKKLVESNPVLTHESVMYILKKLDKNSIKAGDFFDWVTKEQGFKPSLPIYNMMLRILGKKGSIRKFWDIVDKMVEEDCDVEGGTYRTVLSNLKGDKMEKDAKSWTKFNFDVEEVSVDGGSKEKKTKKKKVDATGKGVINLVLGADWNEEVKGKLRGFLVTISEATLLRILRGLRTDPLKALCFFRWVEENIGYTHNAVSYNTILLILGQEKTISEFWIVVKKMKSAGCDIDIDTYVKLSRQFQKRKMMKDAVEIYELMMDTPYKPSVGDCTSLLREISLTNTEDLDLVFRVVNKSEAMGQTLSKAVYDEIHGSLTSAGRFDEAEKVLSIMSKSGYKADKVSYSQVMFGLCKEERLDEACQMLDEMESQGCVSDIKTWSIVIQAHCTAGQMDRAMKLFNKMMKKNIGADANLLEVLVNGLCNEKRVGRAYTLVNEMVEKSNLKPWQATYKNLIEQLLEEKMLPEAMNLLRSMMKHKFPAFPKPFGDYISKFGSVKDAVEFLKALSGNQKPYASASAYYQVLHAFLKEGRETDARNLLTKCPDRIQSRPDILNLFTSQMTAVATA